MIMSRGRLTFFMEIPVLVGSHLSTETVPQVTTFLTRPKGLGKHLTFYNQNEMPVKQTNVLTNDSTAFVCNLSCHCLTCDSGMGPWHWYNFFTKWGLFCQKQISGTGTSNYIPRYLWDVITWYVPLVHKSTTTYCLCGSYLPIRMISLDQSYGRPCVGEETLDIISKFVIWTKTKQMNKTMCIF